MVTIYARLKNQYKFTNHIIFSASFYKINEEDERSDENELFINFNINHNLTGTDIKYQLKYRIQNQEPKEKGWIFDKITSMKKKNF